MADGEQSKTGTIVRTLFMAAEVRGLPLGLESDWTVEVLACGTSVMTTNAGGFPNFTNQEEGPKAPTFNLSPKTLGLLPFFRPSQPSGAVGTQATTA